MEIGIYIIQEARTFIDFLFPDYYSPNYPSILTFFFIFAIYFNLHKASAAEDQVILLIEST